MNEDVAVSKKCGHKDKQGPSNSRYTTENMQMRGPLPTKSPFKWTNTDGLTYCENVSDKDEEAKDADGHFRFCGSRMAQVGYGKERRDIRGKILTNSLIESPWV